MDETKSYRKGHYLLTCARTSSPVRYALVSASSILTVGRLDKLTIAVSDALSNPMTELFSLPSKCPSPFSLFAFLNKVLLISSIALLSPSNNLLFVIGILKSTGNLCRRRKRVLVTGLGFADAPNASRAEVTEPLLPSRAEKSCEKPARPMVSSLGQINLRLCLVQVGPNSRYVVHPLWSQLKESCPTASLPVLNINNGTATTIRIDYCFPCHFQLVDVDWVDQKGRYIYHAYLVRPVIENGH